MVTRAGDQSWTDVAQWVLQVSCICYLSTKVTMLIVSLDLYVDIFATELDLRRNEEYLTIQC